MPSERVVAGLSCSEVLARLSDYVDGDVSAAEKRQIDAHLQGCDHCERFGGEFAGMVTALRRKLGAAPAIESAASERLLERLGSALDDDA
ncbi:MAG: zf-HC2 domain-containing protein [Polyangiaceae bacterium]|nr:zf-HC2 domain-containing protein [Polyangiaceae bacterium]